VTIIQNNTQPIMIRLEIETKFGVRASRLSAEFQRHAKDFIAKYERDLAPGGVLAKLKEDSKVITDLASPEIAYRAAVLEQLQVLAQKKGLAKGSWDNGRVDVETGPNIVLWCTSEMAELAERHAAHLSGVKRVIRDSAKPAELNP
jgi:hypothetical protein